MTQGERCQIPVTWLIQVARCLAEPSKGKRNNASKPCKVLGTHSFLYCYDKSCKVALAMTDYGHTASRAEMVGWLEYKSNLINEWCRNPSAVTHISPKIGGLLSELTRLVGHWILGYIGPSSIRDDIQRMILSLELIDWIWSNNEMKPRVPMGGLHTWRSGSDYVLVFFSLSRTNRPREGESRMGLHQATA